jgi:putative ABC transport system permease protein
VIGHYLTSALRSFLKQRAATLINVLCLALGLAAFVVAYSVVRYQETAERHFSKSERIFLVSTEFDFLDERPSINTLGTAEHVARYLKEAFPALEAVVRVRGMGDTAISSGREKVSVQGVAADSSFLEAFNLRFVAGSPETALTSPRSALISSRVATALFGEANPLGRKIVLDGLTDATVTGVFEPIPKSSAFDFEVLATWDVHEIYMAAIPAGSTPQPRREDWRAVGSSTYVLLADSPMSQASFLSGLEAFSERYVPTDQEGLFKLVFKAIGLNSLAVARLDQSMSGAKGYSITTILMAFGALILAIACVNYANLATGQANDRLKEIGTRRVLGASSSQVFLQTLSTTGVHAVVAVIVALLAVLFAAPILDHALDVEIRKTAVSDSRLWALLPLLLLAVVAVGGGYPAWQACRVPPSRALKASSIGNGFGYRRTVMVGLQFSAACLLLAVVLVMQQQTQSLRNDALGGSNRSVTLVGNNLNDSRLAFDVYKTAYGDIAGVESVSAMTMRPWAGSGVWLASRAPSREAPRVAGNLLGVGDGFFETLEIPMLAGRPLSSAYGSDVFRAGEAPRNGQLDEPRSIVVDRAFAEGMGYTKPEDAVDQTLFVPSLLQSAGAAWLPVRIVGVAENRPLSIQNFGAQGSVYQLAARTQVPLLRVAARDIDQTLARMTEAWNKLAPEIPIDIRFMDATFDAGFRPFSRMSNFVNGLVVLAVGIAIAGLVAMSIHESHHRHHEIAVRKTLGASTSTVAWKLLSRFTVPVVVGNAIAIPIAYMVAELYLGTFLYRIELTVWPFVLSFLTTLLVAWIAVGYQTLRAARLNPGTVLRYE